MARPTTAARRYAEAAFSLAKDEGALDRWADEIALAAEAASRPELASIIGNPAVPLQARREIIRRVLGPRVSPEVVRLVLLLSERGRVDSLPAVSAEYRRLLNRDRGIVGARVTSAAPLDPAELDPLRTKVEALTGARVDITTAVDPALIGGLTIRVGDTLIDASVRGRLERLRERLTEGAR
ncbi:MAG: F0F1 ATP synthase subunit delta [Chloroflexota bacterium]